MSYSLFHVKKEKVDEKSRDFVEQYIFKDLPVENYDVFLFYYPGFGSVINEDLKNQLENFGENLGKNLLVYAGTLKDPEYGKIRNDFDISQLPVIIITGKEKVAAMKLEGESDYITTYVRLDNKHLLENTSKTLDVVTKIYHLFVGGDIPKAQKVAKFANRTALLSHFKETITRVLGSVESVSVGVLDGSFQIQRKVSTTV
jgi:hypothetical protein